MSETSEYGPQYVRVKKDKKMAKWPFVVFGVACFFVWVIALGAAEDMLLGGLIAGGITFWFGMTLFVSLSEEGMI